MSLVALALSLSIAQQAEWLGGDQRWAAFRTGQGSCEARGRAWRILPEASRERQPMIRFVFAPGQNPYVHVNMRRLVRERASVRLVVDDVPFILEGTGRNAWAGDAETLAIIEALRTATRLRVTARDRAGQRFSDYYPLGGSPAAIDAAAAGCA